MARPPDVLEEALETAHIALAELDVEGRFLWMNQEYAATLGQQKSELLGQNWRVTVHPEDQGLAEAAYRLADREGRANLEVRGVGPDSRIVYQTLSLTRRSDEHGELLGYQCLRQNVSHYKHEQAAMMVAIESAPSGLLMLDSSGKILSANVAIERLFGYARVELHGCRLELLIPEWFGAKRAQHREDLNHGSSRACPGRDLCGVRKDGVEIPVQVHLDPVQTYAGELVLCTIIDIAERVRYEEELKLAKNAAETANRAKSDFLARMSHEIRTPMNLIMGMNTLLLESTLNDKQRQHVEISHRNVVRLLRLINGILDLSKVEAGKLTMQAEPFDVHHMIEECAATMASAMEQKGLDFACHIDAGVPAHWIGDAERLHQVLLNLIGNSVKFTERGKIRLRVRSERGEQGETGLRFEVSDTGCGVPADKRSMIFEAFQQAEGSMNRPHEGTGLGLAIAKSLVEMMSGRIWIENTTGPGATFIFTVFFPQAGEDTVFGDSLINIGAMTRTVEAGTRVLIVEDNPENAFLLQAYLEDLSLTLDFAANGLEALGKRRMGEYGLILMDIQMPVMDGYTATREIRKWEGAKGQPRVPIVALTAHALTGAIAESMEAGCDGHETKPIGRADLVHAIARFARQPLQQESIPDPIAALRPQFLANRAADVVKMRDALAIHDFAAIQAIGHNCKGTGAGYGFPEIARAGAALETAAGSSESGKLQEAVDEFCAVCRRSEVSAIPLTPEPGANCPR